MVGLAGFGDRTEPTAVGSLIEARPNPPGASVQNCRTHCNIGVAVTGKSDDKSGSGDRPMTPLQKWLIQFLPNPIASLTTSIIYAALLVGILLSLSGKPPDILYVNVPDLSVEN